MIRAALALAIGFLIAICLIGFGLSSEEPYDTNYDLESYEDYNYDFDTSSFSSDDMESSESDEDFP
ncbi:hypothetical protein [Methanobacterium formicicum]|uniref:Uncharacterized protein n=1 Tax=Methanobacterium formicicum (strain DSM 3637 / PP1) TaxID=1204725 RepID=K2RE31_METFP|nr:hypothetical protein [Methanobacterium formicicum]EKF86604.1 hypothetical protein A994_03948 [Methanobacterium formicicum DSM 3637]